MFIRTKTRKNKAGKRKTYAYLVINKYRKTRKTPKQKVSKYLGRVYAFKRAKEQPQPLTSEYIIQNDYKTILKALISSELKARGFVKKGEGLEKEAIRVDLSARKIFDKGKQNNVCITLNDGFLTEYTLRQALDFRPPEGAAEREIGKALGDAIVSAGIPVDQGLFITLFRKIMASLDL